MKLFYFSLLLIFSNTFLNAQIVFQNSLGRPDCFEEAFNAFYFNNKIIVSANQNCILIPGEFQGELLELNTQGDSINTIQNFFGSGFMMVDKTTSQNRIVLAGGNKSGLVYDTIVLSAVDENFQKIWEEKLVLGTCNNVVFALENTADAYFFGGFYAEQNCQNSVFDAFVLKYDKLGNLIWQKKIGGPGNQQFYVLKSLPNKHIAAFGWTDNTPDSTGKYFLVELDENGDSLSSFTIPLSGNFRGYGMDFTHDGYFILNGIRNNNEIVWIKADRSGNVIWQNSVLNACGSSYYKAIQTIDQQYVFSYLQSNNLGCKTVLEKTDTAGNTLWRKEFQATVRSISQPEAGQFLLAGFDLDSTTFRSNVFIARFDSTFIDSLVTSTRIQHNEFKIVLFPNPADANGISVQLHTPQALPLHIQIFDVMGKKVWDQWLTQAENTLAFYPLPLSLYFYQINKNGAVLKKGSIISRAF